MRVAFSCALFKHFCTNLGIGDSVAAARPLTHPRAHFYLYRPGHQSSKSVCARAALARRESTASNPHSPPHTFDLVLHDERNANLGGHLSVVGREPGPQAQETASLELLGSTVQWSLVWHLTSHWIRLHLLHLGLDKVERQAEESRGKASNQATTDDRHWPGSTCFLQHLLGLRIERKSAKCGAHCACRSQRSSLEKSAHAFGPGDSGHRMHDTAIVPSLCCREQGVRLHANERKICRVASSCCHASSRDRTEGLLGEPGHRVEHRVAGPLNERIEDAEAPTSVDHLPHEASAQTPH